MNLRMKTVELRDYIQLHRAWGATCPGKTTGFTLPSFEGGTLILFTPDTPNFTQTRGVRLHRPVTSGGLLVWIGAAVISVDIAIDAVPGSTGLVVVDGPGHVAANIAMHAQDHVYIVAGRRHGRTLHANLWGSGTAVFFGQDGSANSAMLLAEGEHVSIQVGDDAMFADGVDIATRDSHGIFEIADPSRLINMPASVVIHPHVWLGKYATVGKGRTIGAGAIVGQRAIVTHDVAPATVVGGNPARVRREGVTWTRPWPYSPPDIRAALAIIGTI
jgi:acetyltransferase-like isoleucine patch superfamily enzyme